MTRYQVAAVAALERTFGQARELAPGPRRDRLLERAPAGAIAIATAPSWCDGLHVWVERTGAIVDPVRREHVLL